MTWPAVLIAAAIVAACIPFALAGAWWLIRMTERTGRMWPVFVFIAAAFAFAVGLTSLVVQLGVS